MSIFSNQQMAEITAYIDDYLGSRFFRRKDETEQVAATVKGYTLYSMVQLSTSLNVTGGSGAPTAQATETRQDLSTLGDQVGYDDNIQCRFSARVRQDGDIATTDVMTVELFNVTDSSVVVSATVQGWHLANAHTYNLISEPFTPPLGIKHYKVRGHKTGPSNDWYIDHVDILVYAA